MSTPTQTPSLKSLSSVALAAPRRRWSRPALFASGLTALLLLDGTSGVSVAEARTHRPTGKKPPDAPATAPVEAGKEAPKDGSKAAAPDAASKPAAAPSSATPAPAAAPAAKPASAPTAASGKAGAPTAAAKPSGASAPDGKAEVASAPPKELQVSEPRQQAAREHFMRGVDLYTQGNYPNAWLEFSAAYQIVPLVDLLNNMARCEVRMGRPRDALDHFKRFIASRPNDPDSEYINQEIARLEGELGRKATPTAVADSGEAPVAKPPLRIPVASVFAGAATVAAAIAGGVTLGLVGSRYEGLRALCSATGCPAEDVGVLERQSFAGYGLLGVAGAGAVLTGVLLSIELRRNKEVGLRQFSSLRIGAPLASFALPGRF